MKQQTAVRQLSSLFVVVVVVSMVRGGVALLRGIGSFVLFLALWFGVLMWSGESAYAAETTAVRNVTVIDGTGAAPRTGLTVVIAGGTIAEIRNYDSGADLTGFDTVVEASGGFLIPGFVDTHAHVALGPVGIVEVEKAAGGKQQALGTRHDPSITERSLELLLAFGITSIRDPGGPAEVLVEVRERQARGELRGPTLRVAGEVIDRLQLVGLTTAVSNEAQLRAEVVRQAELGVDWIKLYTQLEPDLIAAGVEEATKHGLPVAAHLHATSWTEASRLGVDTLLHLVPGSPELLGEKAELYEGEMNPTRGFFRWFELVDLEGPEIREMVAELVRNQTTVDPTAVLFESVFLGGEERREKLPDLDLVAPALLENWRTAFHFNIGWSEADYEAAARSWPKALEFLHLLHSSGVKLTVGTDANNPWTVPGSSFHRELEIFVEAGLEPLEVLVMATRGGAEALGLEDRGTVEVGKWADLVLLAADPSTSIANSRRIEWVMQAGVRHDPGEIKARWRSDP